MTLSTSHAIARFKSFYQIHFFSLAKRDLSNSCDFKSKEIESIRNFNDLISWQTIRFELKSEFGIDSNDSVWNRIISRRNRLNIVQNTIFFIINCRSFWTSHTYSSISRIDDERDKIDAFFSAFLIFFKSIDFHVLREIRNEFDSISQSLRIEIDMWFDDCFKSNLVVQCFNLSIKWIVMNVRSMMLAVMRFFHVINFLKSVNVKSCSFIMFKSSFAVACCVDFDESFQKRWWRLKSSNKMWWFVNASIKNRLVFESVNELSRDE